jgi:hypothetical protein
MTDTIDKIGVGTSGPDTYGDHLVAELLVAVEDGLQPESYLQARAAGASDADVRDMLGWPQRPLMSVYADARRRASHADLAKLSRAARSVAEQHRSFAAVGRGVPISELFEVLDWSDSTLGVDRFDFYLLCRQFGSSHEQMLEVHNLGIPMRLYTRARQRGVEHDELVAAFKRDNGDLHAYANGRYV